jgi:hypothetical protein
MSFNQVQVLQTNIRGKKLILYETLLEMNCLNSLSHYKSCAKTRGRVSCCSTCMSVFGCFMVVTCFILTGALLYMHFQLKENVEKIRAEINAGEYMLCLIFK